MNSSEKLLKMMIGNQGYETLEKAIFKRGTSAVIDPLEYYLPLIVVPRTILSWLIQTIKPMKRGETKDVKFPGKEEITIHFEKQDVDQYRAEFIQQGKVIHYFEKQSLPAASAHLMTVGEMYDSFGENEEPKEEPKLDVVKDIMHMNDIKPASDVESIKWEMSHANVKELTSVIGKLVDALVAKEMSRKKIDEELDKMSAKETKGDEQKLDTDITPEEKFKREVKAKENDSATKEDSMSYKELQQLKTKDSVDQEVPKEDKVKRDEGKISKQAMPETKVTEMPMTPAEKLSSPSFEEHKAPAPQTPMTKASSYFKKKAELLMKPYASEAQRRWAHTEAGTKALGGKEAVRHWDKESKGKDLPEKVSKAELPKGAGQPQKPSMPQPPKAAVPPSNSPASSAAKQAQSSARGSYTPPKTPGAPMPKNPTVKPKTQAAPAPAGQTKTTVTQAQPAKQVQKSDYFKSKLGKSEKYSTTEDELYKSKCPHCQVPEFKKNEEGMPIFNPCACFSVMKKDEEGNPYKFVEVLKKADSAGWDLKFHPDADPESVKVFLLTLKAHLLVKKKFDI